MKTYLTWRYLSKGFKEVREIGVWVSEEIAFQAEGTSSSAHEAGVLGKFAELYNIYDLT